MNQSIIDKIKYIFKKDKLKLEEPEEYSSIRKNLEQEEQFIEQLANKHFDSFYTDVLKQKNNVQPIFNRKFNFFYSLVPILGSILMALGILLFYDTYHSDTMYLLSNSTGINTLYYISLFSFISGISMITGYWIIKKNDSKIKR